MDWPRFWGRGRGAGVAEEPESDARPLEDESARAVADPGPGQRLSVGRGVIRGVLITVFLAGMLFVIFGEDGHLDVVRLRNDLAQLEQLVRIERDATVQLEDTILGLREDLSTRERIAREDLGYVRPGEWTFILPDEESSGPP